MELPTLIPRISFTNFESLIRSGKLLDYQVYPQYQREIIPKFTDEVLLTVLTNESEIYNVHVRYNQKINKIYPLPGELSIPEIEITEELPFDLPPVDQPFEGSQLTENLNIDSQILNKVRLPDLNKICSLSDYIQDICSSDDFWKNKIISKHPKFSLIDIPPNQTPKEFYLGIEVLDDKFKEDFLKEIEELKYLIKISASKARYKLKIKKLNKLIQTLPDDSPWKTIIPGSETPNEILKAFNLYPSPEKLAQERRILKLFKDRGGLTMKNLKEFVGEKEYDWFMDITLDTRIKNIDRGIEKNSPISRSPNFIRDKIVRINFDLRKLLSIEDLNVDLVDENSSLEKLKQIFVQ